MFRLLMYVLVVCLSWAGVFTCYEVLQDTMSAKIPLFAFLVLVMLTIAVAVMALYITWMCGRMFLHTYRKLFPPAE